jgi:hypothetical protein
MAKADVGVDGSTLQLDETKIETGHEIRDHVVVGDVIIIAYEYETWDEDNLAAFDRGGNKLWDNPTHRFYGSPFQTIKLTDSDDVRGYTIDNAFNIDPRSGELEFVSELR